MTVAWISHTLLLLLIPDVLFSAVNSWVHKEICKNETRNEEALKHHHIRRQFYVSVYGLSNMWQYRGKFTPTCPGSTPQTFRLDTRVVVLCLFSKLLSRASTAPSSMGVDTRGEGFLTQTHLLL